MRVDRFAVPNSPRVLLIAVVALALASNGCALSGEGLEIELSEDQLQRIVNAVFPLDNADEADAVSLTLSLPVVTLADGSDRIGFGLDVAVVAELEPGEGPLAERADARQAARQAVEVEEPEGRGGRARAKVRRKAEDTADAARRRTGAAVQERVADRVPTTLTGTVAVSSGIRYDNEAGQVFLDGVNVDQADVDELPQRFNDPVLRLTSAAISRALQQTPIFTIDDTTTLGNIADTLLRDITIADGVLRITIGVG